VAAALLAAWQLAAAPARADVLVVDASAGGTGGTYRTLQAAVDAATDGDVVLVHEGFYDETVVLPDRALVITSAADEEALLRQLVLDGLSSSRTVVLRGLTVSPGVVGPVQALLLHNAAGAVRVDSCSFDGGAGLPDDPSARDGGAAARVEACASVALTRCVLRGGRGADLTAGADGAPGTGGPGLVTSDARVAVTDAIVFGGNAGEVLAQTDTDGARGGDGILNIDAELLVSASILEGGDGGAASCSGAGRPSAPAGACGAGGPGGHAVLQTGASAVLVLQGNLPHVGIGGPGGDGTPAENGELLLVLAGRATDHGGPPRRLSVASPVLVGDTLSVTLKGGPDETMTLWVSLLPGHLAVPSAGGVYLLEHAWAFSPLVLGQLLPMGGLVDAHWKVPPLGAGKQALTLHIQQVALTGDGAALGSASLVTILERE
jgi:hypothetical protein